jgi:hypothetical protein
MKDLVVFILILIQELFEETYELGYGEETLWITIHTKKSIKEANKLLNLIDKVIVRTGDIRKIAVNLKFD